MQPRSLPATGMRGTAICAYSSVLTRNVQIFEHSLQRSEQPASSLQAAEINEFYTGNVQQPPHTRLLSCHIERQKNYRMGQFELRAPRTKYRNLQPVHLTFSQISKPLMKQQIERNYSKRLS